MRPSSLIKDKPIKIMKKKSQLSKKNLKNKNQKNENQIWYKKKIK